MSRKRKMDFDRACERCGADIPAGQRYCDSFTHSVPEGAGLESAIKSQGCWDPSTNANHYYQLFKSIQSGSWAKTGGSAGTNPAKDFQKAQLYDAMAGGFGINYGRRENISQFRVLQVQDALCRFELAAQYWRSEFDGLCAKRLLLWLAGNDSAKVRDFLQISVRELEWLDGEIKKFCGWFTARVISHLPEYQKLYRKMKGGIASAIIRRRKHGYKQGQVLSYERVDPFSRQDSTIYERKTTNGNRNGRNTWKDDTHDELSQLAKDFKETATFEQAQDIIDARNEEELGAD